MIKNIFMALVVLGLFSVSCTKKSAEVTEEVAPVEAEGHQHVEGEEGHDH